MSTTPSTETPARGTVTIDQIKAECREVLELASKATPEPWEVGQSKDEVIVYCGPARTWNPQLRVYTGRKSDDAALIARTRTLTPKLARATLALIEAMEEREKSLSGSMWSFESALTNLRATWNQPE